MNQANLFEIVSTDKETIEAHHKLFGSAPFSNNTTSKEAAEEIKPMIENLEEQVFSEIRKRIDFGMTCDEIEIILKMSHQTASARIRGLFLKDMIKASDLYRKTRTGRKAIVWVTK